MNGKVHLNDGSRHPTDQRLDEGGAPYGNQLREIHTTCPVGNCSREMMRDTSRSDGGYDRLSGLHHVYCPSCRHMGMIPSGDVQILFRTAHQYVVAYGPSLSTITVVLTTRALAAYQSHAVCSDEVARLGARWALLSGTRSGTVTLAPERLDSLGFERYLHSQPSQGSALRAV